jgi:hypothetical protein
MLIDDMIDEAVRDATPQENLTEGGRHRQALGQRL